MEGGVSTTPSPGKARRDQAQAGRLPWPAPAWHPPGHRHRVPLLPSTGTDGTGGGGKPTGGGGVRPTSEGGKGGENAESGGRVMRVLPLGTGMALTGLGLAYFGLRLRRH
ncbi:hypothetical protein [Streptomyces zagrosensis]|uniref:Uncharacterized protein n=1 Tax=Streptomyces zagrosensis TaxID=1042984 RepID=A0A7W9Q5Q4_9ACTN|nr:hypothetical protein [Streptomyces zagrosensis]MBB5934030.1 hypothetical protein [Streptomyces zagrosensis]